MVYHGKAIRLLGIAHMILGSGLFILGVLNVTFVRHWSSYFACGVWIGIWAGLTGMFGYLGAKTNNNPINCLIRLMVGFAITACFLTAIMLIIQSIGLAEFAERLHCPKYTGERFPTHAWEYKCADRYKHSFALSHFEAQNGAAIGSLLLIFVVVEFFVSFVSSVYGFNSCTCHSVTPTQPGVQQADYLQQPGTSSQAANQQYPYFQQPSGNLILIPVAGDGIPRGATIQAMAVAPRQQGFVVLPQGYPVHAYQGSPTGTHYKPDEDLPPPYSSVEQ